MKLPLANGGPHEPEPENAFLRVRRPRARRLAGAAQEYPARPIRVITATSAGGTSDIFMRVVGEEFQKRWGQPLIIDNRPGGGMTIGGRACAEAPNDGYTICILPVETLA